ncbi:MAG: transposase family protein [Cetobacterium sp.]
MNNMVKFLDDNLEYLKHEVIEDTIYITVVSNRTLVECPYCSKKSKKLHSYYMRSFQDLPIQDKKVVIVIKNKKFICENQECSKKTFSESFNCIEFKSKKSKRLVKYIVDLSMRVSSIDASSILRKNVVNVGKSTIYNILKKM